MQPVPIYFGRPTRTLFGWYHPSAPVPAQLGVVLCAPLGVEAIMTHRTYRTLAERLASVGYPALRFDYDGTGDSAGSDADSDRLRSWLASIGLAVEELRRRSGVTAVSLFGIRFGATLALLAAADRADIHGVAGWSICPSGRTYVRELHALHQMGVAASAPVGVRRGELQGGDQEAGGFLFSEATLSDLSRLDLATLTAPPSRDVLMLTREGPRGGDQRLAASLRECGVAVSVRHLDGYAAMMDEPHRAIVPAGLGDALVDWLSGLTPSHQAARAQASVVDEHGAPTRVYLEDEAGRFREEPVVFGPRARLFGIVSSSIETSSPNTDTAVVLLNAGGLHHIGPNRMSVHLARRWAGVGFTSLRMDAAGIGDSAWSGPLAGRMYSHEAVLDATAAIDWLRNERGFSRIALLGLCSGAYVAFYSSLATDGIEAQVLLNPETFFFKPGDSLDVRMLGRRSISRKANWMKLLRGEFPRSELASAAVRTLSASRRQLRRWLHDRLATPELTRLARAFQSTLDRGTETMLIYGADDPGLQYLRSELGRSLDMLRRRQGFRLEVIEGPDHTFTPIWSQFYVSDLVTDFLVQRRQRTPIR